MRWLEISVTVDPEVAEAVSEVFHRFNPDAAQGSAVIEVSGFDPTGDVHHLRATVRTYVPDTPEGRARLQRIEEALAHLNAIRPVPHPHVRPLDETEWWTAWQRHFKPLRVGKRLVIVPAWHTYHPSPDEVPVIIEPGMAFGTGLHPSTRLALRLLEGAVTPGIRVLDVGTGSGILAIAAARLGARAVTATDIDPQAIVAARDNIARNRLTAQVTLHEGSLPPGEPPFDVVVVNILHHVILNLLDQGLWAYVQPGGSLLLSGILRPHETDVLLAVMARGGRLVERLTEEDWIALHVKRHD